MSGRRLQIVTNVALIGLGPVLAALTVLAIGRFSDLFSRQGLFAVLLLDFTYVAVVTALVTRRILQLVAARREHAAGSRLHLRLSGTFAGIALIPTVLVAVIAAVTLNFGLENWFSERVRDAVGSSLAAAQAYERQERDHLIEDARFLANHMNRNTPSLLAGPERGLQEVLSEGQTQIQRGLKEAYLIDAEARMLARGVRSYLFDYEPPSEDEMQRAGAGEIVVITDWINNEFRVLLRLAGYRDVFLLVSRNVDGELLILLDETTETAAFYNQLESERGRMLFDLGLVYAGFAVLVIVGAIWTGLWVAEWIARPVGQLARAAQKVGAGNLDVRVREESGDDEVAVLGRIFNRMTGQVKRQRDDLIAANERTERRRRLFDSVLSGVTAGVIGLDPQGRIEVMNAAASSLLELMPESSLGQELIRLVPEFDEPFRNLRRRNIGVSESEITLTRSRHTAILLVRIATRTPEPRRTEGFVVTFDDVTQLVSAQRMAAWGDVARRMAHEIKNPLTPIRLSAEQLRRKLKPRAGDDAGLLDQYADIIIRQTGDLNRIVDEFSRFARLPEPRKNTHDLGRVIEDAVALQRPAHPDVQVTLWNFDESEPVMAEIDETMISRALTNLIKNSGEAVAALPWENQDGGGPCKPEIRVSARKRAGEAEISIADNGVGFPKGVRSRLFEPYVTHRDNGTGLGLSIVKKIVESHGGSLELLDAPVFEGCDRAGALARVVLPLITEANESGPDEPGSDLETPR